MAREVVECLMARYGVTVWCPAGIGVVLRAVSPLFGCSPKSGFDQPSHEGSVVTRAQARPEGGPDRRPAAARTVKTT